MESGGSPPRRRSSKWLNHQSSSYNFSPKASEERSGLLAELLHRNMLEFSPWLTDAPVLLPLLALTTLGVLSGSSEEEESVKLDGAGVTNNGVAFVDCVSVDPACRICVPLRFLAASTICSVSRLSAQSCKLLKSMPHTVSLCSLSASLRSVAEADITLGVAPLWTPYTSSPAEGKLLQQGGAALRDLAFSTCTESRERGGVSARA
mmetsp:Transcript_59158/g.157441  ORF Transcript_59158/g.157441 Transcript_59158/m.157441 type:complete len:206 (-) Transcript_59158:794-1411(-)